MIGGQEIIVTWHNLLPDTTAKLILREGASNDLRGGTTRRAVMWKSRFGSVAANSPKKAVWPGIKDKQDQVGPDSQRFPQ